jgi:hypothetical protein
MASGDSLCVFEPKNDDQPTTNFATLDTRNSHPILRFDKDTNEAAIFPGVLPRHYDGGGVTVMEVWMADGVTINDVVWQAQIERHQDDAFDLDADGFAAAQSVTATAPTVDGEVSYDDIAFLDGAEMDSLEAGESFRLKITRNAATGGDTLDADAQLLRVEIRET